MGEALASGASDASAVMPLRHGEVAYVTTGAPLPLGADAVVPLEMVEILEPTSNVAPCAEGALSEAGQPVRAHAAVVAAAAVARRVRIRTRVVAGAEVRAIGSDVAQGSQLLGAGTTIGPAEVGLAASMGGARLWVHRRPRAAVLSTGDELLDPLSSAQPPATPTGGRIYDSNRAALLAAVEAEGAIPLDLGIVADGRHELSCALDKALAQECDILISSGGVSMGARDFLGETLDRRGTLLFDRVLMKPGKPLTFATVSRIGAGGEPDASRPPLLVFGLPGNPVSALVCFSLVIAPALRRMLGRPMPLPRRVSVVSGEALKLDPERPEYHRATLTATPEGLVATSTGRQISSRLLSCASAHALLELPKGNGVLPAGTQLSALLVSSLSGSEPHDAAPFDGLPQPLVPINKSHNTPTMVGTAHPAGATNAYKTPRTAILVLSSRGNEMTAFQTHLATRGVAISHLPLDADVLPNNYALHGQPATSARMVEALKEACASAYGAAVLLLPQEVVAAEAWLSAARAMAVKRVPSFASVMQASFLAAQPPTNRTANSLVLRSLMRGEVEALVVGHTLLIMLPSAAEVASADALMELLPTLRHACAQLH